MGSEARARLGLGALGAATLLGFEQVFAEGDYAGPALLGMLLAVGLVIASRRFGLPTALILPASLGALFWYLALVFETRNLLYGLPTLDAARGLATKISFAYEIGKVDYAPVPLRPGYVAATVAGLWIAATLGELGTFRWRQPVVAAAPAVGLFSFVTIVGPGDGSWFLVALFLTALLTFWALSSAHLLRGWGRWLPGRGPDADERFTPAGGLARKMGAACVAAALVSPVALPALESGLLSWRTGGGGPGGTEGENGRIDPLVAIQPRLLQQSDTELFRVASDEPAYWRLVSLGGFDGRRWHPVEGELSPSVDGAITTEAQFPSSFDRLVYSVTVTGLRGASLPAAAEPVTVLMDAADAFTRQTDLHYNAATGDLYLRGGVEEGTTYQVETYAPSASRETLAQASVEDTVDPIYLELPDGISDQVRGLGERWTAGAESPYEKLVAIQDRLRSFEYSTQIPPASSSDYLTEFLTETRIGYCQQFATAFAVLARLHGIPTRVVVGFLPGDSSPDADYLVVKGTHAHAWPEAHFEGIGWVAFEPTPRSVAAPPDYSVPEAQQVAGDAPPPEGQGGVEDLNQFLAEEDRFEGLSRPDVSLLARVPATEGDEGAWRAAFSMLARALGALLLASLLAIPALKTLRFRLRYRAASTPVESVAAAYAHLEAEARELASARRRSESAARHARRLVSARRLPQIEAYALAALYETATFGPHGVGEDEARRARRLSRLLRRRLWSGATPWERIVRLFSPRGLVDRA